MEQVFVDENGYNQFLDELSKLKQQEILNSTSGSEAYQDAIGDGWHDNFAFEEAMRQSRDIAVRIDEMMKIKKSLKIVKKKPHKENIIDIGDTLKIKVFYSDFDIEDMTIKLTGNYIPNINPDSEIQEITINSPLGKALYLRMINDNNIKYIVNDKAIMINIIEKIPNEE